MNQIAHLLSLKEGIESCFQEEGRKKYVHVHNLIPRNRIHF